MAANSSSQAPDFLLLAASSGHSISSLAEALERDELWVARVLSGKDYCTAAEAASIVDCLNVEQDYARFLVGAQTAPAGKGSPFLEKFVDKVVLGAIALGVALLVQYQFNAFTVNRERAVAVSNFKSEFLLDRYAQIRADTVSLLVDLEEARRDLLADKNSDPSFAWPGQLRSQITRLEVDIGVIASAQPQTQPQADALVQAIHDATADFLQRDVPDDFEQVTEQLVAQFLEFGSACQNAIVETVEDELEEVQERTSLWRQP